MKPTNEMGRLGLLASIPGIELAIAALQEQLRQMKEDAGNHFQSGKHESHRGSEKNISLERRHEEGAGSGHPNPKAG
jgi:hypothetical protein